jgi:hypothetical protein
MNIVIEKRLFPPHRSLLMEWGEMFVITGDRWKALKGT